MEQLRGRTALVTGATGGIGREIARRLAREGMNVLASGRREEVLADVVAELGELGVRAAAVPADLSDLSQVGPLVEQAEKALGEIDLLVNNAGVELAAAFPAYASEELTATVDVNLTAPMLLTHRVLPGMLSRGRGHVVFISSMAGKFGPAHQEPYAATKAGLIGLNQALRAEYVNSPVGFSVICPGFTAGEGMYQRMVEEGIKSNRLIGETTTAKVAERVLDAVRRDRAEVVETGAPVRPLLALLQIFPGLAAQLAERTGGNAIFRRTAAARDRLG
ncbi:MAG TPA: SDR family NAD(P)-dependent oxidoreductase [Solirubrobacterales bacterium]|nr:SDR family NAD(P)-dependent oxidoreductase [Solirubrobacterales bacterium]